MVEIVNEGLTVKGLGVLGNTYFVNVNGNKYGYSASPEQDLSIEEIQKKFEKMCTFSAGKALAWLKKVTMLDSGSVKGKSKFESMEYSDEELAVFEDMVDAELLKDSKREKFTTMLKQSKTFVIALKKKSVKKAANYSSQSEAESDAKECNDSWEIGADEKFVAISA